MENVTITKDFNGTIGNLFELYLPYNSTIACSVDSDCPNIGYHCYNHFLILESRNQGVCFCLHTQTLYGVDCEKSRYYAKVISITIAVLTLISLCDMSRLFCRSLTLKVKKSGAFFTTALQNMIALLNLFAAELLTLIRIFNPASNRFWRVNLGNCFTQAAFVNTIGAAFNISLLWIEVSMNGKMSIVMNIRQTRLFLISLIALLYVWLLFFLIFGASRMTQVVDLFALVLLSISFVVGSQRITKLLLLGKEMNAEITEEIRREQQQQAEIARILRNARVVFCSALFSSFQFP